MSDQCDGDSLQYNDYRCYIPYQDASVTWNEARTACEGLGTGSNMALIKDSASQIYLQDNLPEPSTIGYWIGAQEARKWIWDYSKIWFGFNIMLQYFLK